METKKYNKNSWHAKLYKSTYGISYIYDEDLNESEYIPDNICEYGKKLAFAILLAPFSYLGHIYNLCKREYDVSAIYSSIHVITALFLGLMTTINYYSSMGRKIGFHELIISYLFGLLDIIIIIGAALVICYIYQLIAYILEEMTVVVKKFFKKKELTLEEKLDIEFKKEWGRYEPKSNPIGDWVKSFKGKYCSKISWE